jgi:hypothetical protein
MFLKYIAKIIIYNGFKEGFKISKNLSIYREWITQIKSKKQPLQLELPWLTIDAKNYMEKFLKNNKNSKVFEYGSGGSSLFFSKLASEVYSIEHDPKWFSVVCDVMKNKLMRNWSGFLIEPEIVGSENTKNINNPNDYYSSDSNYINRQFVKYSNSISKFEDGYFDLVLIDGRSRPSCIMNSFNKLRIGGLLIIDNSEREYYYEKTLKYLINYNLEVNTFSALIGTPQFTRTNIYRKTK